MPSAEFAGIGVRPKEHEEGQTTKLIEQYTSLIPSGFYLGTAIGSMGLSLTLQLLGKEKQAMFVGQWAPVLLLMGLYNKLVKLEGSD
jgi:hypothetical protein